MAKIMIIDDDPILVETLTDALQDHEVVTHDRLDGAVELLLREQPDLLILDVMFPEQPGGGFDLAREIRTREPLRRLPVLFLTAINRELPGDLSAQDMGDDWFPVQGFLNKPVAVGLLRSTVEEALSASRS